MRQPCKGFFQHLRKAIVFFVFVLMFLTIGHAAHASLGGAGCGNALDGAFDKSLKGTMGGAMPMARVPPLLDPATHAQQPAKAIGQIMASNGQDLYSKFQSIGSNLMGTLMSAAGKFVSGKISQVLKQVTPQNIMASVTSGAGGGASCSLTTPGAMKYR